MSTGSKSPKTLRTRSPLSPSRSRTCQNSFSANLAFKPQSRNAEVVRGDATEKVESLKRQEGKDILVYGGPIFGSSLLAADLIDELHIFVNPTALGSGRSMFKDLGRKTDFNLVKATSFDCGVAVLEYSRKRR